MWVRNGSVILDKIKKNYLRVINVLLAYLKI